MPILDLQRRMREAGRIRLGDKAPGKGNPRKLDTFRLTSHDDKVLDAAAAIYGGKVTPWDTAPSGPQWQLVTHAIGLDVVLPPADVAFSQWFELWSGGGCQRRCDGQTELLGDQPCLCDPDNRECSPHTRLSLILPDLPTVGLFRLDTQGWNAATELSGAVDLALAFAQRGTYLPAELRLEQREQRKPGQPTKKFVVPVLDLKVSMRALSQIGAGGREETGENGAGVGETLPSFTPVPTHLPTTPVRSIEEQLAPRTPHGGRKAVPIPASGLAPGATVPSLPTVATEGGGADVGSSAPQPVASTPDVEPPPDEGRALPLASRVAMWIAEITPTHEDPDDFRHRFLEAVTEGQITSAKDFPVDTIAPLRAALVRYRSGEIQLRDGEAVFRTTTSPPTITPVVELFPDYENMKVAELAALCRSRGLTPEGNKANLIALLEADDQ